jgi:hypothetical protein
MFGMGDKKKKEKETFCFDIEKELKEKEKQKQYAKRVEKKVIEIKELLRKGSKKEEFDHLGTLLNGYHALAVVMGRAAK